MIPKTQGLCDAINRQIIEPVLAHKTPGRLLLEEKANTRRLTFVGLLTPPTELGEDFDDIEGREGKECMVLAESGVRRE